VVSEAVTALNNGETLSADVIANLQEISNLVSLMDSIGVGENILAGIAEGMTAAGTDTSAETVATNLEAALNAALGIQSPSTRMKPVGENIAAGVGEGMKGYDMSGAASAVATGTKSALTTALARPQFLTIGRNAMLGLGLGILSGRAFVVAAIRTVARAAVLAAKAELKIQSPSRVFRDEVGRMAIKGLGQGALLESKAQAKVIQNAARFLTGAAQAGVGGSYSYDNRKTYNQKATSTIRVDKLYVRDEQDIRSLAIEIASLTRRQQRGRGLRMA